MRIRSFTKTIIKSTFLISLMTNLLAFLILFIVCSNLISQIYETQRLNSASFISDYINDAINTDDIFKTLHNLDVENSSGNNIHIKSIIENKQKMIDGLKIFYYKNDQFLSTTLPIEEYLIFSKLNKNIEIKHKVIYNSNKLYIVDIKQFGEYTYFQLFNASDNIIIKHLYQINGLLGYKFNELPFFLNSDENIVKEYNVSIKSTIEAIGIDLIYSNTRQVKDKILLFLTIFSFSLFRFLASILNAKRNIQRITEPLDDLVKNTEKLAAHEVSEKLHSDDYPYSEFKKLADAFNKVLLSRELSEVKLFRSFEQMETVVHKRTQELISTNEQLKTAIKKAEEVNALKSQFLANISHEVRTPLNCIMGFCDIILTEDHSEQVTDQVKQILHESETLLHLINDLLDYSKIDAGKMKIIHSELDIRSLINSLIKSGQIQAGDKSIKLINDIDDSVPVLILSDELRLYQVISNIFYNAIKFTPTGSVTIKVECEPTNINNNLILTISIIDTGIGIPENRINSIFNKFEQVDGSLTRKYRGSGLGLTICKTIIELMKGKINVTSDINKGSCFKFSVPIQTASIIKDKNNPQPKISKKQPHVEGSSILLVEDYPVNQIVAKKHLEMDNHNVTIAENGQEALEKCSDIKFDLILMDLQMPIMDGFTATKQIRGIIGLNTKTPILAMTANAMDTAKQTCLDSGMNGVITKPIRKKMFLKEVDRWLNKPT